MTHVANPVSSFNPAVTEGHVELGGNFDHKFS
jgi:hypothetical protein